MIRIKLVDGEVVETNRHTYEQANAAITAGIGIVVGGMAEFDLAPFDGMHVDPERTIYPVGVASIEDTP